MKYYIIYNYDKTLKNHTLSGNVMELPANRPSINNLYKILESIKSLGYDCAYFGGISEIIHAINNQSKYQNCCFLNFIDGIDQNYSRIQVPVLLDILNVPYGGSGVFESVLMNNKHYCKQILSSYNIPMPQSYIINNNIPFSKDMIKSWSYPIFVKPNCEEFSLGISDQSVCHTYSDLYYMMEHLLNRYKEIIIEEFISGIDVTNYLVGNPGNYSLNDIIVSEVSNFSSCSVLEAKKIQKRTKKFYLNEEKLSNTICKEIQEASAHIAQLTGANDICKIDYRFNYNKNQFYFLEINSLPSFNSSEIEFLIQKKNISFENMLDLYISASNDRIVHPNI